MTTDATAFIASVEAVSPELAKLIDERLKAGFSIEQIKLDTLRALNAHEAQLENPGLFIVPNPSYTTLTPKDISDLLTGAFEGNWMTEGWVNHARPVSWTRPEGHTLPWYCDESFIGSPDFKFEVNYDNPNEGPRTVTRELGRAHFELGLAIMAEKYPRHWADLTGDNADAITYDVALQCIVLGEIVYG